MALERLLADHPVGETSVLLSDAGWGGAVDIEAARSLVSDFVISS